MAEFQEVAAIRDEDNVVVAIITAKPRPDGSRIYSYTFMREFENQGRIQRTTWLNERHSAAVQRLVPEVVAEIRRMEISDRMAAGG